MLIINFRKFKFRRQLLFLILPLILIPIFLVIFLNSGLYNYFEKEKISAKSSLVLEFSRNIDMKINELQKNIAFENVFSQEAQNLIQEIFTQNNDLVKQGYVIILNKDLSKIYSNIDDKTDKELENLFLNDDKFQPVLENKIDNNYKTTNAKSVLYKTRIQGTVYYAFILDTINLNFDSGIKLLYFMQKKEISSAMLPFILWMLLICFVILGFIAIIFIKFGDFIVYPLDSLNYATKKASQGFLNINFVTDAEDEFASIFRNLKELINSYKDAIVKVIKTSENMSGYQNSFSRVMSTFDGSLKNQLKAFSGNINLYSELNNILMKSSQNIKDGQNVIKQADINSNNSSTLINEMVSEINKISETSKEISFIIELINGISEKTRLLSVNSAIEASRAGDAGKGFAVVATEIRKLAMQTKDASAKISELIKSNENIINSGVNKTYEVISSLKNIDSSIKFMNSIMERLGNTIQEGRKKAFDVMNLSKNFSSATTENFNYLTTINKYKVLSASELSKISDLLSGFILDSKSSETVRDIKLFNSPLKSADNKNKELKKFPEFDNKNKYTTVKSIALYKQKQNKSIIDKIKK